MGIFQYFFDILLTKLLIIIHSCYYINYRFVEKIFDRLTDNENNCVFAALIESETN